MEVGVDGVGVEEEYVVELVDGCHGGACFDDGVAAVAAVCYCSAVVCELLSGGEGGGLCRDVGCGEYVAGDEEGVAVGRLLGVCLGEVFGLYAP